MSDLSIFKFENCDLRTVVVDGDPFFVGKDVALALGYIDPITAMRSHCRGVQKLHPIVDSLGRTQEARIISEPDLMRLVVGSTLPAAQKFEIPKHLAQIEATKEVLKLHGVDFSPYLKIAPAQQNILREEESLEPTDLGKTIGYTEKDFNLLLVASGMQVKTVEGWFPTEEGKPYATVHSWAKGAKSGYNLKWRRSVLKQLDL